MKRMPRHPLSSLGKIRSYEERRRFAVNFLVIFVCFVAIVAFPPLGLVIVPVLVLRARRRHKANRAKFARRLPLVERRQMYERAAMLQRLAEQQQSPR